MTRCTTLSALAAASIALASGCGHDEVAPVQLQGVVLVLLDTVRADHVGCYGYERPTTPVLDALAEEGALFENVISSAPWTLPSVSALLAGQYSERVFRTKLSSSLVERLQQVGIETAAFTEGGFVSRHFAHDRGFDSYEEEEGAVQVPQAGETSDAEAAGGIERTFARAGEWLRENRDGRFFLFVHTYESHAPYTNHDFTEGLDPGRIGDVFTLDHVSALMSQQLELTPAEAEYVTAMYDGDLRNSDRHVGQLLALIEELGLREKVAVVVTSDHGEELNDHYPHNTGGHGHSLRDPLLKVPLIVRDPTRQFAVKRVSQVVRLIDVMPTVLDMLDVSREAPLDGRTLLPVLRGEETRDRVAVAGQTNIGPFRVAVRAMGFKYIVTLPNGGAGSPLSPKPPFRQLYDLKRDPHERDNLARKTRLVATFDELLRQHHPLLGQAIDSGVSEDTNPQLLERLRSLGYVR